MSDFDVLKYPVGIVLAVLVVGVVFGLMNERTVRAGDADRVTADVPIFWEVKDGGPFVNLNNVTQIGTGVMDASVRLHIYVSQPGGQISTNDYISVNYHSSRAKEKALERLRHLLNRHRRAYCSN